MLSSVETWHPVIGVFVYLTVNYILGSLRLDLSKSKLFKTLVFFHNVCLCAYSAWTCYHSVRLLSSLTFEQIYDPEGKHLFSIPQFEELVYFFDLSKYYELFDTWIHYLKNKKPLFLQVFHHIGAVIFMGLLHKFRVEAVWHWIVLNAGVHTIMYFYYAFATIGLRFAFKSMITTLQMTQFVVGLTSTLYYLLYTTLTNEQYTTLLSNNVYVLSLLYLFNQFYKKTYSCAQVSPRRSGQKTPVTKERKER